MTRRIISPRDQFKVSQIFGASKPEGSDDINSRYASKRASPPAIKTDDYAAKVLKLIPAEVVAVFITVDNTIRTAGVGVVPVWVYWGIFVLLTCGTYAYILRMAQLPLLPPASAQATLSAVSFVVWVFAIGGPFVYGGLTWYRPVYGALVLPLFTFLVPILFPKSV